jgi:hypothetical protein
VESGDDRKGVELGRASARSLFGDHQGVSAQDDVLTTGGQWKAAMIEEGWPRLSQLKQFIEMAVQSCLQTGNSRGPTRMSEDRLTTDWPWLIAGAMFDLKTPVVVVQGYVRLLNSERSGPLH